MDMNVHGPILLAFEIPSVNDDRSDRFTFVHQVEPFVDFLELEGVGDHRIDLNFAVHVPVDDFWYVGAAAGAAECRTFPDTAGDKLERPCGDFLAGFGHADHHGYAPATMTGFERLPHHGGVAGAVKGEIGAAIRQRHQMLHDIASDLLRVDEVGHAESAAPVFLGIVDVDADDLVGADHLGALNDIEADAAETEYDDIGARRYLGGVDHGADPGRDATTDVATLVERRVFPDFRDRDFRQHGEVRERRAAHVVIDGLALVAEARGTVGPHALALGGADSRTQIGLLAQAAFALATFWRVERNDVVAWFHRSHAGADFTYDASALVAEDGWKQAFAVEAIERVGIRVANAGGLDLDQDLTRLRPFQIEFDNFQWLLGFESDGGACLHGLILSSSVLGAHTRVLSLGVGRGFIVVFRRSYASHRIVRASSQVDVEIVQVASHIRIIAKCRHDVFLCRTDVLAAACHRGEEFAVAHGLQRVFQGRRVARSHAVRPVADVTLRVIAAVSRIGVPIDGAVSLDFVSRVSLFIEIFSVFGFHRSRIA